jgi:hypothetical protein
LFWARAVTKADSTLPLYQAIPAGAVAIALLDDVALVDDIEGVGNTPPDAGAGVALCFEHPAKIRHNAIARQQRGTINPTFADTL